MKTRPKRNVWQILTGKRHVSCALPVYLLGGLILIAAALDAKKPDKPGGGNSGGGGTVGGIVDDIVGGGGNIIGDPTGLTTAKYHLSEWNVRGDYQIVGPTIMVIDGDFDIGNNTITIAPTGSLIVYVGGDADAKGNGAINNTGVPSQFILLGTHPRKDADEDPDHSLTLSGNGALTGVVYAPNAEYRTNGGGNAGHTSGSIVALQIRFNGSPGPFHFDIALRDLDLGFGGFKLDSYQLKASGDATPSEKSQIIFGSSDYAALFSSLF